MFTKHFKRSSSDVIIPVWSDFQSFRISFIPFSLSQT
jgi:hypothetical protein